jgi:hypothetical protein
MNKRILKLAKQALNEYNATYHNEAKIPEAYLEKFAELIVKECIDIVRDGNNSKLRFGGVIHNMKIHFGVEE